MHYHYYYCVYYQTSIIRVLRLGVVDRSHHALFSLLQHGCFGGGGGYYANKRNIIRIFCFRLLNNFTLIPLYFELCALVCVH